MSIKCPVCHVQMEPRKGKCKFGSDVKIDQCPQCGGLWGDHRDFYRVDLNDLAKVLKIDKENSKEKISTQEILHCPRCPTKLEKIRDPFMPQDINLEICANCQGVWMSVETFLRYKEWREEKKKDKKSNENSEEQEEKIKQLLVINHHEELRKIGTLGKFAKFFKKPVGRGGVDFRKVEWEDHERVWFGIMLVGIIISLFILSQLINLFLG